MNDTYGLASVLVRKGIKPEEALTVTRFSTLFYTQDNPSVSIEDWQPATRVQVSITPEPKKECPLCLGTNICRDGMTHRVIWCNECGWDVDDRRLPLKRRIKAYRLRKTRGLCKGRC